MFLERVLALAGMGSPLNSYSQLGHEEMQSHLTGAHGMGAGDFGHDFAHPESLASWHGMDHMARSVGHDHLEHAAAGAGHAADSHSGHHVPGAHLGGLAGHMAAWEAPSVLHRFGRREADRQTRRPIERHIQRMRSQHSYNMRHGGIGATPQAAGRPSSGASSSGSSGSSGSGGGGGNSGGGGGGYRNG